MTEVDIIHDLECCCNNEKCDGCSRRNDLGSCSTDLKRDAMSVIKLQKASLENAKESIERLTAEVKRFESAARLPAVDELINLFNRIIQEAYYHGEGWTENDDEARDNWGELIYAMKDVHKKLHYNSDYTIVVDGDYPLFQKR